MDEQNTYRISPFQHDSTADVRQWTLKVGKTIWIKSTNASEVLQAGSLPRYVDLWEEPVRTVRPDPLPRM